MWTIFISCTASACVGALLGWLALRSIYREERDWALTRARSLRDTMRHLSARVAYATRAEITDTLDKAVREDERNEAFSA